MSCENLALLILVWRQLWGVVEKQSIQLSFCFWKVQECLLVYKKNEKQLIAWFCGGTFSPDDAFLKIHITSFQTLDGVWVTGEKTISVPDLAKNNLQEGVGEPFRLLDI